MDKRFNVSEMNTRPLLIIDETRIPCPNAGEMIIFCIIQTTVKKAYNYSLKIDKIREKLNSAQRAAVYKGSDLFGSTQRNSHQPLRACVSEELARAENIVYFIIHNSVLSENTNSKTGGFVACDENGAPTTVYGRELLPICNVVKQVANEQNFGTTQVDVLLDRSAQLGLAPKQMGISNDKFQLIGPTIFNGCDSLFRIFSVSEKGISKDLLLLPDSAAYNIRKKILIGIDDVCKVIPSVIPWQMWYENQTPPSWLG